MKEDLRKLFCIFLVSAIALSACSSNAGEMTPTLSIESVQTQAVSTFAAALTQTVLAMPTSTQTPTQTITPTATGTPVPSLTTGASFLPTGSCFSLAFLSDVTIPDNTVMKPGEQFTKTWRVRNTGSCAWDAGFKVSLSGGNSLGGAPLVLTKSIAPGTTTDLSVLLTAPNNPGSYQSNWRISNSGGAFFGDEFYVVIKVGTGTGTTTSSQLPGTSTPSVTTDPGDSSTETSTP